MAALAMLWELMKAANDLSFVFSWLLQRKVDFLEAIGTACFGRKLRGRLVSFGI